MTPEKRYSIFISSTYEDLKEEREEVQKTILRMDHFPIGMEQWPAADEEQFEFIKKVIDESDYYVVIVGGRYGTEAPSKGVSYTEMEYDYALARGLKVIALIHGDPQSIPSGKTDLAQEKLQAFKEKLGTGRMRRTWTNMKELSTELMLALQHVTKTAPATGWIRGNQAASDHLREENVRLREELLELKSAAPALPNPDIAGLDDYYDIVIDNGATYTCTWGEILTFIGPSFLTPQPEYALNSPLLHSLNSAYEHYGSLDIPHLKDRCLNAIKVQFLALDLIEVFGGSEHVVWQLTPRGKAILLERGSKKRTSADDED